MVYAERGNKVVAIKEESVQKYIDQGYMIKSADGKVIHATIPTDVPNLRKAYAEHIKEIKALKEEIQALKQQLQEMQTATPVKKDTPAAESPEKSQSQSRRKANKVAEETGKTEE